MLGGGGPPIIKEGPTLRGSNDNTHKAIFYLPKEDYKGPGFRGLLHWNTGQVHSSPQLAPESTT